VEGQGEGKEGRKEEIIYSKSGIIMLGVELVFGKNCAGKKCAIH
jgi:hypothetical protein